MAKRKPKSGNPFRMHAITTRAIDVCQDAFNTVAFIVFIVYMSTVILDKQSLRASIETVDVRVKKLANYATPQHQKHDLGYLIFDLEADLTDLFAWNVLHLYVYLVAEYRTRETSLNQIILWDAVLERGDSTYVRLEDAHNRYYFWDDGNGLLNNRNVTLSLRCNIVHRAGLLPQIMATGMHTFAFPAEYSNKKK